MKKLLMNQGRIIVKLVRSAIGVMGMIAFIPTTFFCIALLYVVAKLTGMNVVVNRSFHTNAQ